MSKSETTRYTHQELISECRKWASEANTDEMKEFVQALINELHSLVRLPDCYICGKPQTKLGAIDLEIDSPDVNGYFSGRKLHRHEECESALPDQA